MGFAGQANHVYDCLAELSAKEGFLFAANLVAPSHDSRCVRCVSQKNAAGGPSGTGQGITVESQRTWLIDTVAKDNYMAGIDFLGYNAMADPAYGGCIRCVSDHNGQSAVQASSWDSGIYVDGGHDLVFIDCVWKNQGGATPNTQAGFAIGTEHPATNPVFNIVIINGRGYNNTGPALVIGSVNPAAVSDITVLHTTLRSNATHYKTVGIAGAVKNVRFENNIVYQRGSSGGVHLSTTNLSTLTMDRNVLFSTTVRKVVRVGGMDKTLAQWQAQSGQDLHSSDANPQFVDAAGHDYLLQQVATGHPVDSPALNVGRWADLSTWVQSLGTTRTDGVPDDMAFPDAGWHMNLEPPGLAQ
jgi:hypothetical protein